MPFNISMFGDEIAPELETQLRVMSENGVFLLEMRGVDGKPVVDATASEHAEMKRKLDSYGVSVWSIGSPIGKIEITDDFAPHFEKFKYTCETAQRMGTKRIRAFSFYMPQEKCDEYRSKVIEQVLQMVEYGLSQDVYFCHENEGGIYGQAPERCLDLIEQSQGKMRYVFDAANYICHGYEPFPHAFDMLEKHIDYIHIKDADGVSKEICVAGKGDAKYTQMLSRVAKWNRPVTLSLEPHLTVFSGRAALEKDPHLQNTFATGEEAFKAALCALKNIIADLN